VSTVCEAIEKSVFLFGVLDDIAGRVREERLVKLCQEPCSSCRVRRVAKPRVNGVSRAASGTLNEHAENRHSDDKRYGTDGPLITS
jgi:hypothetical protein